MWIERIPYRGPNGVQPQQRGKTCKNKACSDADIDQDVFEYTRQDLDSHGKLHVIIHSTNPLNLATARRKIRHSKNGSGIDHALPLVNGFSAHIDPRDLERVLHCLPAGVSVHKNRVIDYPDAADVAKIVKDVPPSVSAGDGGPRPTASGLDPSRAVIGIEKVWAQGFTGKGVGVAVIDSGIYPHPDLEGRVNAWIDIADGQPKQYDKFAHGTHISGLIAGSGKMSSGRFKGIAPDANLEGVRITTVAEAIKGLQWCIENKAKYNIRVVNMSLGDFASKSYKDDPWAQACEKAIDAGLIVVVAAGNEGPGAGTISTPGTDPRVITVGALDDKHTLDRKQHTLASFESDGPTSVDNLTKPDVIAPGVSVFSTLAPGATLDVPELPHVGKNYIAISGTSMATAIVSGLIADMVQANPNLKQQDVKQILEASADRYLKDAPDAQGYGLINAPKAIEMALAMKNGAPAPTPPPLPKNVTAVASAPTPASPPPASLSAQPPATAPPSAPTIRPSVLAFHPTGSAPALGHANPNGFLLAR